VLTKKKEEKTAEKEKGKLLRERQGGEAGRRTYKTGWVGVPRGSL